MFYVDEGGEGDLYVGKKKYNKFQLQKNKKNKKRVMKKLKHSMKKGRLKVLLSQYIITMVLFAILLPLLTLALNIPLITSFPVLPFPFRSGNVSRLGSRTDTRLTLSIKGFGDHDKQRDDRVEFDDNARRRVISRFAVSSSAFVFGSVVSPGASRGATAVGPPSSDDLSRIKAGYDGIQYLLENWDKETTVCRENGGECKRDAEPVRRYMGLRSTTDPLFQIEKVFGKVKNMELDGDQLEKFFEATEEWNTAMNMSNSMAFISQFGEYNPGGGKEEVLKYLNESKKQVVIARDALRKIMEILSLPT